MTKARSKKTSSSKHHQSSHRGSRSNPKSRTSKSRTRNRTPRTFYTVGEDAKICHALSKVDQNYTKSKVCQDLGKEIGRSRESVRDRIKRYLGKLSSHDRKNLHNYARKHPSWHLHWEGAGNNRKIKGCHKEAPVYVLPSRGRKKKITKSKKAKAKKRESFDWLVSKLNS